MSVTVEYLEPAQLASALRHPQQKDRVLVLDVRDEDYLGGHIRGAVNSPSELWLENSYVDELIDQQLIGKDMVVVHCMFSQQRGPRCATRLFKRLNLREGLIKPTLYMLRGGFSRFAQNYRFEDDLVEGYNEAYWRR